MFGFAGGKILIVLPLKGNKDFISLRQSVHSAGLNGDISSGYILGYLDGLL